MSLDPDRPFVQLLRQALSLHQGSQLGEAETLYRRVLELEPRQHDALRLLGVLYHQQNKLELARQFLDDSLTCPTISADAHHELGLVRHDLGQFKDAIASYGDALRLRPNFPEALYNLGNTHFALGQQAEAADCYRKALSLRPDMSDAWLNLSAIEEAQGNNEQAIQLLQQAIHLQPNHSEALLRLGAAYERAGQFADAEKFLRRSLAENDSDHVAHLKLASVLDGLGRADEARCHIEKSIKLSSENPEGYFFLGTILIRQNRVSDAVPLLNHAAQLDPTLRTTAVETLGQIVSESVENWETKLKSDPRDFDSLLSLAKVRFYQGRAQEAIDLLERALAVRPADAGAEYAVSFAELVLGNFERGWKLYESRFNTGQKELSPRKLTQPFWTGENLQGRTILLHAEQGLGDTLQFVRYARLVANRGGRVIVECQPPLKALLQTHKSIDEVFGQGETLPAFDFQIPLLSLPKVFKTTLESIPSEVPYLEAPNRGAVNHPELSTDQFKVGLVWAGSTSQQTDLTRSVPLSFLAPILSIPDIAFFSLQVGPASCQLKDQTATKKLFDLKSSLTNFASTAAALDHLDLVITVDTAVAHLSGALARPTWVLIPFAWDWRWLMHRTDSPWYPTMRLFRQSGPNDWASAVESVAEELRRLIKSRQ